MYITQLEPVMRVYCDKCGTECKGTFYGRNGKDYCSAHCPWTMKDVQKRYAIERIKAQPFIGAV